MKIRYDIHSASMVHIYILHSIDSEKKAMTDYRNIHFWLIKCAIKIVNNLEIHVNVVKRDQNN